MKTLIEMKAVTKNFYQNDDVIEALKITNFKANEGELIAIIGPSGSGKSTFLTILGGLQTPTTGEVLINNKPFSKLNLKGKSKIRFEKIGFILQTSNLIPFLTVKEQMILYNRISKSKSNQTWIEELFTKLDVKKLENKYPSELSGGERQRVAIAKALYHNPSVIFADEPTAEVDTTMGLQIVNIFKTLVQEEKLTVIMTTHDPGMMELADMVYTLEDGEVIYA